MKVEKFCFIFKKFERNILKMNYLNYEILPLSKKWGITNLSQFQNVAAKLL